MKNKFTLFSSIFAFLFSQCIFAQNAYKTLLAEDGFFSTDTNIVLQSDETGYLFKKVNDNKSCFLFFSINEDNIFQLKNGIKEDFSEEFIQLTGIHLEAKELEGTIAFCAVEDAKNSITIQIFKAIINNPSEEQSSIASIGSKRIDFNNGIVANRLIGSQYNQFSADLMQFSEKNIVSFDHVGLSSAQLKNEYFSDFSELIPNEITLRQKIVNGLYDHRYAILTTVSVVAVVTLATIGYVNFDIFGPMFDNIGNAGNRDISKIVSNLPVQVAVRVSWKELRRLMTTTIPFSLRSSYLRDFIFGNSNLTRDNSAIPGVWDEITRVLGSSPDPYMLIE